MSLDKTYSLSELATSIQSQLSRVYSGSYWISAEVLKLNHYLQSGHCYPQLVEKKDGKIVADLKGFILSSRYKVIKQKFLNIAQKELGDGMQIRFRCKIGFHPVYGLSLNILDIDPTYTLGEMTRLRNEAIAKLKSEGIFELNRKLHLPLLLKKVAVISVETSKGFSDFNSILDEHRFGKLIKRELFPALLQGDAAIDSISRALKLIQVRQDDFDAVVIIRGGGGETGLDCYDSYNLSQIICQFPIPVLTGIGHATNLTIVEQVSYKNLITPSQLASFILRGFELFEEKIARAVQQLNYLRRTTIQSKNAHLNQLKTSLEKTLKDSFKQASATLSDSASQLAYRVRISLRERSYDLSKRYEPLLKERLKDHSKRKIDRLLSMQDLLPILTSKYLLKTQTDLNHKGEKVKILDPVQTLKRGYSITYLGKNPLKDVNDAKTGETIKTLLSNGEIKSRIL